MAKSLTNQTAGFARPNVTEHPVQLASARHVRGLTLRVCHAVAWHIYCVLSRLSDHRDPPNGMGAMGRSRFHFAFSEDAPLAIDGECNASRPRPTIVVSSTRLTRTRALFLQELGCLQARDLPR